MFSAKNYGLPKDLIEAAKKVHEKQLEEGAGKYAEPRMEPKIRNEKNPAVSEILHSLAAREKKEMNKKLPGAKKPQAEEVQFTEEELAEAFAIFLEENFHVEMLTEEDLDYVFENEFPQWLEEVFGLFGTPKPKPSSRTGVRPEVHRGDTGVGGNISKGKYQAQSAVEKGFKSGTLATKGSGQTGIISKTKQDVTTDAGKGDTMGGETSAPVPTQKPTPKKQVKVSAKPAVSARKQTGGPSLFQQAKKAVRPTPGDSGRTATDRLKYMAARGNRASQKALRGPKKDWRSSVFNPDGN